MSRRLRRAWSRLAGRNEIANGVEDYGELKQTSSPPAIASSGHGRSATLPPSPSPALERSPSTAPIRSQSNGVASTSAKNESSYATFPNGVSEDSKVAGEKAVAAVASRDAAASSSALDNTHTTQKSESGLPSQMDVGHPQDGPQRVALKDEPKRGEGTPFVVAMGFTKDLLY
jgi:hypothetical protein